MKLVVLVGVSALILFTFVMKLRAERSIDMKIERFAPPPHTPNCVSSVTSESDSHFIKSISFQKPAQETLAILKSVIEDLPRTKLITTDGYYLHFEFRSSFFGFIDDVELRIDEISKTIQIRSASRVGQSDLGVNRRRMENIRSLLNGKI